MCCLVSSDFEIITPMPTSNFQWNSLTQPFSIKRKPSKFFIHKVVIGITTAAASDANSLANLQLSATSGTATEGTDYTDGSGSVDDITISAGSTTGTVSFTPTDDSVYEGDEKLVRADGFDPW